jgi:nucleotide-binding universal stress UspA family protein
MNERILLGVDADLSSTTQHVLRVVSEFMEQAAPQVYLILLNVIPLAQPVTTHPGLYVGQMLPANPSTWQRTQAEEALRKARIILQQQGIALDRTEGIIRVGAPADEIVKVAKELHVRFIVIGSRGDAFKQRLRRLLVGSISRRVLRFAPCPVMIVVPPLTPRPSDLVTWYTDAITHYLKDHTSTLSVFTPQQAARQFAPPHKKTPGRKEIAAATLALEQLAKNGVLCRHDVKGELRYVND